MIKYVVGDLLNGDTHVIAHQANCFSTMGSGIARAIRETYPEAAEADRNYPAPPEGRLGKCSFVVTVGKNGLLKAIFNLYGQYAMGGGKAHTNYEALESALNAMMELVANTKATIGVPYKIGCGLGGGDWSVVEGILERVSEKYNREIQIYVLPEFAHEVADKLERSDTYET